MRVRAGAPRHLAGIEPRERRVTVLLDGFERLIPRAELGAARRRPQPPVAPVVRIHAVLAAKRADAVDRLDRREREPHGLVGSADLLQRPELRPPAEHEATVPAARSSTAHVGLDEDDVQRWIVLLQSDRGPEAREAAADDADVGALLALESRRVLGSDERLLEPEAPHEATVVDRPM